MLCHAWEGPHVNEMYGLIIATVTGNENEWMHKHMENQGPVVQN